jgi:predicted protein tyrosine phosphatase
LPVLKPQAVIAQAGVRHGKLYLLPVNASDEAHSHGAVGAPRRHLHLEPIS